jgi:Prokaryotic cytochrome b561
MERGKLLASTIDKRCSATASTLAAAANGAERPVLVWDLPIRLFHWLAVVLVAAAYLTWQLNWMDWHAWVGDALLALLLFRLLWGFFGSETARFLKLCGTAANSGAAWIWTAARPPATSRRENKKALIQNEINGLSINSLKDIEHPSCNHGK